MTPFSARLTFFGFLGLAGAIAANALYFQEPLESSPGITGSVLRSEETEAAGPAREKAREAQEDAAPKGNLQPIAGSRDVDRPDRGKEKPAKRGVDNASSRQASSGSMAPEEVTRAIQRELAYRDYAVTRRDGKLDTSTRLAILNYQYDAGMTLTGRPSESVLKTILFGTFQAAPDRERIARLEGDRVLVARVQRILSRLGFGNLPESGRLGAETRRALREFAAFRDLPRDGRLAPRVLLELADVTDEPLAGARIEVSREVN